MRQIDISASGAQYVNRADREPLKGGTAAATEREIHSAGLTGQRVRDKRDRAAPVIERKRWRSRSLRA